MEHSPVPDVSMAVSPQYEHQYCIVKNAVNQPVLLGDSPAPSTFGLMAGGSQSRCT